MNFVSTHSLINACRSLKPQRVIVNLVCLMFFIHSGLNGQVRPSILIDDLNEDLDRVKCLCQPGVINNSRSQGVSISYNFIGSGSLKPVDLNQTDLPVFDKFRNLKFKLAYPIIRQQNTKVIINAAYQEEQFEFSEIENDYLGLISALNQRDLRKTRFGFSWVQSISDENYFALRFQASFNGAYSGIVNTASRYAIYSGIGVFAIKKSDIEEFGLGLAYTNNFRTRNTQVLPFLFWNKSFTPKWGIESTIPTSFFARHNVSSTSILLAGVNYNSDSYSIDFNDHSVAEILSANHSELLFTIRMQQQIVPWLWLEGQAGLQKSFRGFIENQITEEQLLSVDPSSSPYFKIGLFISPPDSYNERHVRNN